MPAGETSVEGYLSWLSEEITGLPDMFSGVNENFATAAIEGALAMAGDSVDLDVVRGAAAESGAYILPAAQDVQRAAQLVLKKWWHLFGYDYVLAAIRGKHEKLLACLYFCFDSVILTLLLLFLGYAKRCGGDQGCSC
jgi:hypothetical protein